MEDKIILNDCVKWWEKKRLWFNIVVGTIGTITMLTVATYFNSEEFIGLLAYGLTANLFYSLGLLLEIFDQYYFNNYFGFNRFRYFFLIMGIIVSCIITFFGVFLYYMPIF